MTKRSNQKGRLQRVLASASDSLDVPKLRKQNQRSKLQRMVESATDSLDVSKSIRAGLPGVGADTAKRAGFVAAGVAGVTAGSAGISSLRRRGGEATFD